MTLTPPPTTHAISFVDRLASRGSAVALIDHDGGDVTYGELAGLVGDAAEQLGSNRRLVQVVGGGDLSSVVWYLGALQAGHAVLLTGPEHVDALGAVHRPDVVVHTGGREAGVVERVRGTAHDLHPELALLLSTSGSTGSPKLVRLSHRNIDANAAAIATYLGLTATDRSITTLPMHYCYGLSVLHSHLAAGAGVVLNAASVVDPCFWAAAEHHRVTNFAGVPHTFELLDRVGVDQRHLPHLRFITQAGGRMAPETVRRFAVIGARQGWDLYVMYGQTEATARMAYLPPERASRRPEAVGVAVPGGSLRLDPFDGCGPGEGEVVYSGPNVMMGYADGPDDLASGAETDELRTGDIGRFGDDGLLEIVGRRRDFVKPFGLRIDLGAVDALLADAGIAGRCAGDDDGIAIGVRGGIDPAPVVALVRDRTGLPAGAVAVAAVDDFPRLGSGKLDRRMLLADVRADVDAGSAGAHLDDRPEASVSQVLARILGVESVGPTDTFVSLGGDSLSYVEASIALEEHLGYLPDGWHLLSMSELGERASQRGRTARVETSVVLRAVSIVLIVGNHAGLFLLGGGAHVLFAAAGFNFARFQLGSGTWWRSILRLAAPAVVWIGAVAAVTEDFDLAHAALVHGWLGGRGRWSYWFVEVLVQVLVVLALVLAVPAVRRFERRNRFLFPGLLLLTSFLVRFGLVDVGDHHRPFFRPQNIVWIFLLGWMAAQADTVRRRVVVSAATLAAVPGFFGDPRREAVLLVGMLLLLWVPSIPVVRPLHKVVGVVAGASLYTYLTHFQVHPTISDRSPAAGVLLSLAVGVLVWRVAEPLVRRIGAQTPSPWRPAPDANRAAPSRVSPLRTGTRPSRVSWASASSNGKPHCS